MTGTPSEWLAQTLDPDVRFPHIMCLSSFSFPSSVPQVGAVVVGFDLFFNYMKLIKACSYLSNPACHFIATNEDQSLPAKSQIVLPGRVEMVLVSHHLTSHTLCSSTLCTSPRNRLFCASCVILHGEEAHCGGQTPQTNV